MFHFIVSWNKCYLLFHLYSQTLGQFEQMPQNDYIFAQNNTIYGVVKFTQFFSNVLVFYRTWF